MSEEPERAIASPASFYHARSKECIGNGTFASRSYGAGEQITALKRPLVGSLDTGRLRDTCANCYVWTEGSSIGSRLYVKEGTKVQVCAGCKRFRYCSLVCQKEAWKRGHKHECKALKPISDREIPKAVLATMEILIRRKHGLIPDEIWQMLCQLGSHIEDFKQNGKYGGIELMAMGTSQFSWTQDTFNKDFVAGMYARVLTNSMTLVTPTFDPLGIIIDPILGHINHSCAPNAYIVMDGAEAAVRTLRPIKKNEEIFISYIDSTNPRARRQSELEARWFFACQCSKCQKGAPLDEDKWAVEPLNIPKKWKKLADEMIDIGEEWAISPANHVGDTRDDKRLAAIQGRAFQDYEEEQGIAVPEDAIKKIEDDMRLCSQSGLWPIHRQPYAALRDDLIVNMLAVGNYENAWAQCAKRYRYILPKLYPQIHHPVRVVQTWQTAMLALHIAGEPTSMALPGVDMSYIAFMLVLEVLHASRLSHGEHSSFARSVQGKYEEMAAVFKTKLGPKADEVMAKEMPQQRAYLMEMGTWVE
ncbi:hypothetical protein BDV96DRAFT_654462 [Lophiotrema nucula]|uniref:Uncharacterized protein n=1 Tax=Lophiotrema nucula TaxID=690887 RepID=A0A6A5YHE6_9PLEO|nr:hypothetical protein BDV96DRAFT_654462 [Lophiotrema nucula]